MKTPALPVTLCMLALGVAGCGDEFDPLQDSDGDGVLDVVDICPQSTGAVDRDGCDPDQPPDPEGAGLSTFVVGADEDVPLVFRSHASAVSQNALEYAIDGTMMLETALGHIQISNTAVDLLGAVTDRSASLSGATTPVSDDALIEGMRGIADVSLPDMGVLEGLEIEDVVSAEIGFDYGRNLDDLNAPLAGDRRYVFFKFDAGLDANLGPVGIGIPQGSEATVVVDPADPSFYARGSISGLGPLGDVPDVGFGMSAQGLIPFEPGYTWGIEDEAESFDGHIYLDGTVPVGKLPLSVRGEAVLDADPDGNGETIFAETSEEVRIGANGVASLSLGTGAVSLDIEIGGATVVAELGGEDNSAYFSAAAGTDELDLGIPLSLEPVAQVNIAGYVSEDLQASYLTGNGDFVLELPLIAGINLHGDLNIDSDGFEMNAVAGAFATPLIDLDGEAATTILVRGTDDWSVKMVGNFDIVGMELADDATLEFTDDGVFINGEEFDTPW